MTDPVFKTRLPNGLTVHLKEIHTAPIISHWVWYRVGSRNEPPGLTGISHWVEHMQFKGTPGFPAGMLDKAISRLGGFWNAFTYLDWTAYFETLPADKIDLALQLEADRMTGSLFDPKEVESERTVIISEREGDENEPMFRLGEAVQQASFKQHSYHHEVIGDKADLRTIQRDDLYNHYRGHYHPGNAVLAMAGDFETPQMLARIEELYGTIPGGQTRTYTPPVEPPPDGEKRVVIKGPGETTYVQLAIRSPASNENDFFALTVIDSLLTGPTSLNMFGGGGISNRTTRLYRALVERELTINISGGLQATHDPFLYYINMILRPERSPDECLKVLDGELDRLCEEQVSDAELQRAMKQARALFAYGSENITNQAFWLGFAEMFATYDWFIHYVDKLAEVTPADVQRAARQYLAAKNRVVGIYLPEGGSEQEGGEE